MIFFLLNTIFFSYFISCFAYKYKRIFFTILGLLIFLISSIYLRIIIPFEKGADFSYYVLKSFDFELSRPLEDPMISFIYYIFSQFYSDKVSIIKAMYVFIFIICSGFYTSIIFSKITVYKKIILFSTTYFFFSYTLLRNAISYQFVFFYFYALAFYKRRLIWVLITAISFHFSSILIAISQISFKFLKKYYLPLVIIIAVSSILIFLNVINIDILIYKVTVYSKLPYNFKRNHLLWLIFISILVFGAYYENKNFFYKSHLYLIFLIFLGFFVLNPIPAFRVSIYFLIGYCAFSISNSRLENKITKIDLLSVAGVFCFFLSYIKTLSKSTELIELIYL